MIGAKTLTGLATEMKIPVAIVQQLLARGIIPEPYDVDDVVKEANMLPSGNLFHVRKVVPPDIWFSQAIYERMRIGKGFYEHPARTADFKGFDPEKVAVYEN